MIARLLAIEFSFAFQKASVNTKHQSYLHDAVEHMIQMYKMFRHPQRGSTEALEHGNSILKDILRHLCSYRMKPTNDNIVPHRSKDTGIITYSQSYDSCLIKQAVQMQIERKVINNLVPNRKNSHAKAVNDGKKLAPTCLEKGQAEAQLKLKHEAVLNINDL